VTTEQSEVTSTSSESEHDDEKSDLVDDDFEKDENGTNDDDVPLYEGAKVSKLGALIVIMLFSLRHKLSGQALIDLVKVLRALLPDGHKFVTSAYLLKKYFADLFGEPEPKKHCYCGNCLGKIRRGHIKRSVRRINVGMQRRRLNTSSSWIYTCVYVSYTEVNKGSLPCCCIYKLCMGNLVQNCMP